MSGTLAAVPLHTADISVGDHITRTWFGLTFNVDTMWGTVLAGTIVIVLGLLVARSASHQVPGKLQIFFETFVEPGRGPGRDGPQGARTVRGAARDHHLHLHPHVQLAGA